MKNINRKMISFILAIAMIISLIPSNLFIYAADESTMDVATDAPGESLPYGEVIATIRPNDEGKVRLYTGADIHASYSDVVWEESYPKTVKLVNYYEDSYVEGGYSFAVYLYQVETLDGEFWPYATNVWIYAPYLEDVTYTKTAEDEAFIGKKLNVVGTVDEYGDLISTWHNDPLNEIYLDKSIYDWTEEDTSCVFTVTDVYRTPWGEWYRVTTDYTMMAEDFDDLWVSATDVKFIEAEEEDALIENLVDITMNGKEVTHLALSEGEKEYIFTNVNDALGKFVSYQWQILIDKETDSWANIYDYIYSYAAVSEALVKSCLDENDSATIRCIVSKDGKKYVSEELTIFTEGSVANDAVDHSVEAAVEDNDVDYAGEDIFQLEVNYVYLHSSNLDVVKGNTDLVESLTPFVYDLFQGTTIFPQTAVSPTVSGYLPYRMITEDEYTSDTTGECISYTTLSANGTRETYFLEPAPSETFENATSNLQRTVYYVPQKTTYVVSYFYQNVDNDSYYIGEQIERTGEIHALVDQSLDIPKLGFDVLAYNKDAVIRPNGATHVGVYYDRLYFVVSFQGYNSETDGYEGVTPYYVRYGTDISLPTPTKGNYGFDHWELVSVETVDINGETSTSSRPTTSANIAGWETTWAAYICTNLDSNIMLMNHNLLYRPVWSTVPFTIRYFLEKENIADGGEKSVDNYDLWHTTQVALDIGSPLPESAYLKNSIVTHLANTTTSESIQTQIEELINYLSIEESLSSTYVANTLPNDNGSTVINIYYKRNTYTLRIYYARFSKGSGAWYNPDLNQIILAPYANAEFQDQAWGANSGGIAIADAIPSLVDENFKSRETIIGSYTYYSFDIVAKYGANLPIWPSGNTFSTISLVGGLSQRTYGGIYRAWNGGSGGIQGIYTKMDANLINPAVITNPNEVKTSNYVVKWITFITRTSVDYVTYLQYIDEHGNLAYPEQPNSTESVSTGSNDPALDPPPYPGYVLPTQKDGTLDYTDNTVTYQYNLAPFNVFFDNQYGTITSDELLYTQPGNTSITVGDTTYALNTTPVYPADMPTTALTFDGWYLEKSCTTPVFFSQEEYTEAVTTGKIDANDTNYYLLNSMPAQDLMFYAKWIYNTFDVAIYFDGNTMNDVNVDPIQEYIGNNKVAYNTTVDDPQDILFDLLEENQDNKYDAYKNMTWLGWWYTDQYGRELRFDFASMAIKQNYVSTIPSNTASTAIYAKWSTEYPVEYVVNHVTIINGVETPIAAPEFGSALHGREITYKAKISDEFLDDFKGYLYLPAETEITKVVDAADPETYEITFVYELSTDTTYTIQHTFDSTEINNILGTNFTYTLNPIVATVSPVKIGFREGITEPAIKSALMTQHPGLTEDQFNRIWSRILQSTPDIYEKELMLSSDSSKNLIHFVWTDDEDSATYQVNYYQKLLNGNYELVDTDSYRGKIGDTVTATQNEYTGFALNTSSSNLSGKVIKPTYDGEGNLLTTGLILNLYYDRESYTVTIYHSKKTLNGDIVIQTATRTALYQESIEVEALNTNSVVELQGYYAQESVLTATIFADTALTFHYLPNTVTITYTVANNGIGGCILENKDSASPDKYEEPFSMMNTYPAGATPIADIGYEFEGWYTDEYCTVPVPGTYWKAYANSKLHPPKPAGDITYYAKFVPSVSDLHIQNIHLNDSDQAVIYTVQGTSENSLAVNMTFTVIGNSEITITNLPVGDYTITVHGWSWRYTTSSITHTCDGVSTTGLSFTHNVPTIANSRSTLQISHSLVNNQWLSDNAVNP